MAQILKEHKVESKEFLAKELFNERKFDKAFPITLEADQNDPQIVYNLGFMYYFGKGVRRDRKKGMLLVKKRMRWGANMQIKFCAG
jgi:TPR repeat protein